MSKKSKSDVCYIIYTLTNAVNLYYEQFLLTKSKSILDSEIDKLKRFNTSFYVLEVYEYSRELYLTYDASKNVN